MRALLALCCCMALGAQAETFNARVIAVLDGDTVLVLHNGQKQKVRLANIDAPEMGHAGMGGKPPNSQKDQPYGVQSREALLQMVGKQQVQVESRAVDQYGRIVGLLTLHGRSVNEEQVRQGMAWEYSHYHSDKRYIALQAEAQQAHRGLWAQAAPQPPWQWRELHPSQPPAVRHPSSHSATHAAPVMLYDMECGRKHLCSQMKSCDEARFYLNYCGVNALDGNHDGMPCENLCSAHE